MAKPTIKQIKSKLRLAKKQLWECLRRNPDYIQDFAEYKSVDKKFRTRWVGKVLDIASKYLISFPIDPGIEFNDEIEKNIKVGWLKFPKSSFDFPISRSSLKVVNGHSLYNVGKLRMAKRSEVLESGRYLTLKIDVSLPSDLIAGMIGEIITEIKHNLGKDVDWGAERNREDDFKFYLPVWDKVKAGLSQNEIAKQLFPRIDLENACDRVRRYYKRIKHLIAVTKYPEIKKNRG